MLFVLSSISQFFFPSENENISLLSTFATYTIALLVRPIGGAFFGAFGDKIGQKKILLITIIGFSVATSLTGLLPVYSTVGILAPSLLILLRFIQGFFVGGEWGSGAVITMETIKKEYRGIISGFLQSGFSFGFLLASLAFTVVSFIFQGDQFTEIGWRILFLTGMMPGMVSLIIRIRMSESPIWTEKSQKGELHESPLKEIIRNHKKAFFSTLVLLTGLQYIYYTSLGFMPTFLGDYVSLNRESISLVMVFGTSSVLLGSIFCGSLSQRIGRVKVFAIFGIASVIIAIPVSWAIFAEPSLIVKTIFVMILSFITVSATGVAPAFLAERFPTHVRNSASGFVYNGDLIVGALAPLISLSLFDMTGKNLIPYILGTNIIIGAIFLIIAARINPETKNVDLKSNLKSKSTGKSA
jgi:MFS family permease